MPEAGVALPSGVLAFLLTDVEGSTKRWEEWPGPMSSAVARHDAILRTVILARNGHVFRTAGDAFFAAFASPATAIDAALSAQYALAQEDFSEVGGLTVRMAVHAGLVEARDNDYFGQGLYRCARLLSVAYGGQVLISAAAADTAQGLMPAKSSLLDLGQHRLRDVSKTEQVFQLVAPGLRTTFPTLRSVGAKVHNLPRQLTSFVRRDAEITEIKARLNHYRLVTLTGSGGAGKTRIALEVGSDLLADPLDGIWFVELAHLDDSQLVAETLCSAIGVPVGGSCSATESAVGYLRQKNALVILDNCEHLIDAVARLVEALMRGCASLSILDTSRERLEVPGENSYRVPSLAVPPFTGDLTASAALEYAAVRLFVERANATVEGFALTDADAAAVANICRQLDGIPMAIELAVPQLRMLSPKGLEARLQDRFLLLVKGSRTALPRHQTLATVFDWSYNLLNEAERQLFRRLSVFMGGWTLEAAISVASGSPDAAHEIFGLLSILVDKSLVVAELSANEPRYKYLQTTRQYAFDRLLESGERGLRRRLCEYMIGLSEEASASWPTMATDRWLAKYEPDLDNLRASLDWAFGPQGDASLGVELTGHSVRIWDELSLLSERERWFAAALERASETTPSTTLARLWLGRTSNSSHGARSNLDLALKAAEVFRNSEDRQGLGEALAKAGAAIETPGSIEPALPYLHEALEVLKPLGATKHLASCLRSLAVARYFIRDFEAARPLVAESEAVARSLADDRGIAAAQIAAAELEFAAGAVDEAIDQVRKMLAGNHYNRRQLTLGLGNLTSYLLAAGRSAEAKTTALEGLREARALVWQAAVVRVVEHLALVATLDANAEAAARLLGYCVAFYSAGTASREFTELSTYDRLTAYLAQQLAKEQVERLMSEGALWTEDRAVEAAMSF
jgi:predicted ATPase/class 3 adenylate cyclase